MFFDSAEIEAVVLTVQGRVGCALFPLQGSTVTRSNSCIGSLSTYLVLDGILPFQFLHALVCRYVLPELWSWVCSGLRKTHSSQQ